MATRQNLGRTRALRPSTESLEGRQLLSGSVSGVDTAGDHWTLTLSGRGSIQVIKQPDATGTATALTAATEIKTIILSGTDPNSTVLTDTVTKAAGSDGRIFFENLVEQTNRSERLGTGLGIQAVNIPDFWLGVTDATTPANATQPRAAITIPDGVTALRFGGADTTRFFGTDPTQSLSQDGQNDQFLVRLGIPAAVGTSIVVNQVISNAQAATSSSASPTQKSVVFDVGGRINLFQANAILGSSTIQAAPASFTGGTIVSSLPDPNQGITGEIGFVRVGGNATNFSVVTNNTMANFYVGGETNNISVLAPNGTRNFYFGKGADSTTILTHSIENFFANRGMINSRIVSDRQIGDLMIGGDVVNSTVLSGYFSGLATVVTSIENSQVQLGQYFQSAVTIPTPTAQAAGKLTTYIAGNVTNSVFAASDQSITQSSGGTTTFGNPQDVFLPLGVVTARVEGTINNATATPSMPTRAFYGQTVNLTKGVVVPPNVVEMPLSLPAKPITLPGIPRVFPQANGKRVAPVPNSTNNVNYRFAGGGTGQY